MSDKEDFDKWWEEVFVPEHLYFNDSIHEDGWDAAKTAALCAWQAGRARPEEKDTLRPEYNLAELKPVLWNLELMYKHRGERIPRFMTLTQCVGKTKIAALEEGRQLADKWLRENFKLDEIELWEVKARRESY